MGKYTFTGFLLRAGNVDGKINGQMVKMSGEEMVESYRKILNIHSSTLFSLNGPSGNTGIGAKRWPYIDERIDEGLSLFILLKDGKIWEADVLEVISKLEKIHFDDECVPAEFKHEENRTWLRIKNLRLAQELTSADLKFENNHSVQAVIGRSQLVFGYVRVEKMAS